METLQTERLILRPFRQEDARAVYGYASNPNVGPAAGWKPHESIEESEKIVTDFIEKGEVRAIVLRASGQLIGSIGLHHDQKRRAEHTAMLGYVLDERYWGHGYMTEAVQGMLTCAFETQGIKLVSVQHFPFNTRSKRVIEKCGFVLEGQLRYTYPRYDGVVLDEVCYSMMEQEYQVIKKTFPLCLKAGQ